MLCREFVIEHSGHQVHAAREVRVSAQVTLLDGANRKSDPFPRKGFSHAGPLWNFPPELPLVLQVFIIWLAMTLWKRAEGCLSRARFEKVV